MTSSLPSRHVYGLPERKLGILQTLTRHSKLENPFGKQTAVTRKLSCGRAASIGASAIASSLGCRIVSKHVNVASILFSGGANKMAVLSLFTLQNVMIRDASSTGVYHCDSFIYFS